MHILRSERLGALWCGVAVLVCLWVEGWRVLHPAELEPLAVSDVLRALDAMPGPLQSQQAGGGTGRHGGHDAESVSGFRNAQGPIEVGKLDSAGWVFLGLSPKQARAAVRYSMAAGGIRDEQTLRRMRVLPKGWVDHYASSLQFEPDGKRDSAHRRRGGGSPLGENRPAGPITVTTKGAKPSERTLVESVVPLEINAADSLALMSVKGIGPWVTGRILAARRRWGGFAELRQLTEALDGWDSLANALAPLLSCDPGAVPCRCADTLSLDQWRSLPGLNAKSARVLERYVHHHGGAKSQVLDHPILDSAQSGLLSHYLCPCLHE